MRYRGYVSHTLVVKESEDKNLVSKPTVIVGVLLQQFEQATIAGLLFLLIGPTTLGHTATVDHQKTFMAPLRATAGGVVRLWSTVQPPSRGIGGGHHEWCCMASACL
ncbi:hypothetical protein EV2_018141 [Malus domestica]